MGDWEVILFENLIEEPGIQKLFVLLENRVYWEMKRKKEAV